MGTLRDFYFCAYSVDSVLSIYYTDVFYLYRNQWQECSLYSNVLWLDYLCKKMKESKYSRPSTASHKQGLKDINTFDSYLMNCNSAFDCLTKCAITKLPFHKHSLDINVSKKSILVARNSVLKSQ